MIQSIYNHYNPGDLIYGFKDDINIFKEIVLYNALETTDTNLTKYTSLIKQKDFMEIILSTNDKGKVLGFSSDEDIKEKLRETHQKELGSEEDLSLREQLLSRDIEKAIDFKKFAEKHPKASKFDFKAYAGSQKQIFAGLSKMGLEYTLLSLNKNKIILILNKSFNLNVVTQKKRMKNDTPPSTYFEEKTSHKEDITARELRWLYRNKASLNSKLLIFDNHGSEISIDDFFKRPEWKNYIPREEIDLDFTTTAREPSLKRMTHPSINRSTLLDPSLKKESSKKEIKKNLTFQKKF